MLAAALLVATLASAQAEAPQWATLTPTLTDAPLLNPGMGTYIMVGQNSRLEPDHWLRGQTDIAYHRCHWADLEPERGQYRFEEYLGPFFDYWVGEMGMRVAFRVMCESMHGRTRFVTPQWVFDAGVPGVEHTGIDGETQLDPVFWDPTYLKLHCEFIGAFGEWANGREGLEFVDIGSIGEWGEMHFGLHIDGRWTEKQLKDAGFTEYGLAMAYRQVIDTFAEAFPDTRVFLNVGGRDGINDYAAMRGIHFRQDGLGLHGASYNVESKLYPRYAFRGVQCNLELHSGYQTMIANGWDVRDVIRKGLEAPLSYQNLNFGWNVLVNETPPDVREAVEECARRIGYRFAPVEVRLPAEVHSWEDAEATVPITVVWENQGVAPCYESLAIQWAVTNPFSGLQYRQLSQRHMWTVLPPEFPDVPTTQWMPGQQVETHHVIPIPAKAPERDYRLAVRLLLPGDASHLHALPLESADDSGLYQVGTFTVTEGGIAREDVLLEGFEQGPADAGGPEGIAIEAATDPVHTGAQSLRIAGQCARSWNWAALARTPLIPGATYRLTCWLLVRRVEGAEAPYVKMGMNDAEGEWIDNKHTERYDMGRLGEWQELSVEFSVPVDTAQGDICIERGSFDAQAEIEAYADDIELRVLTRP